MSLQHCAIVVVCSLRLKNGGIYSAEYLGMCLPPSTVESTFRNQKKLTKHSNHAEMTLVSGLLGVSENQ